jgi:transcriptional regulator with XRE-family HTH domain
MSDELIGRRLRAERERRRITLESIAANTKIGISLLKALERDDVSRWPSGIFRRSFVRAYAEAIGLDGDEVVRDFLDQHPDPHSDPLAAPPADPPHDTARRVAAQSGLRLTMADTPQSFSAGHLLAGARSRLSAVAWDGATTLAVAVTAYVFFENFWAPLGVFMLFYYLGSVLILGNTPGVSLFAPAFGHQVDEELVEEERELTPDALGHAR